jgi:zinc transport system substrate-binding protein
VRKLTVLVLMAACGALGGCHKAPPGRASVGVSVFPVYDLVRRIAGPDADVTLLTPSSPPMPQARLFVLVGLGLDTWMDALEPPHVRVLKVGDRVPTLTAKDGAIDPHVWLDPQRARLIATAIAEDLARADSSHANAFRERAAAVDASLDALDHEVDARASAWRSHAFATSDPGMAYYAERYRLDVVNDARPGVPKVALDSVGGSDSSGTYEALVRSDTAALDSALR